MAKKNIAAIVSGAGWIGSLACGLVNAFRERGATDKQIHSLVIDDGGEMSIGKIADTLMEDIRKSEIPGRFFMTVELGSYPDGKAIRETVMDSGKKIGYYAGQILEKIKISSETEDVDLWEVSGTELGFTKAVPRSEIYKRAFELGFKKCPSEAVALSRIKCEGGKWRIGGMEPEIDPNGDLVVLYLHSDGDDLWLYAGCGDPDYLWGPGNIWVFVQSRRK